MKLLIALFALTITVQANARLVVDETIFPRPVNTKYNLIGIEASEPVDCGYALNLKTNVIGNQFVVSNTYVYGSNCPVFVKDPIDDRSERFYYINDVVVDGCGSTYIQASRIYADNENGIFSELLLADHSQRRCRDLKHKAIYEITEILGGQETLYLAEAIAKPRPLPTESITCMAYWTGYEKVNGRCMEMSSSGCSNPFAYETKMACEQDL